MPLTEGLKLLVRKTQPDFGDWLELLEARKRMFNPYLDMVSLGKLGDVMCLGRNGMPKGFREDAPIVQGDAPALTLETQGIFSARWKTVLSPLTGYQASPGGVSSPDGVVHFWGLTRSSHWIRTWIEFKGHPGYQVATVVVIQYATPGMIIQATGYTAKEMWEELGRRAFRWLQDRHRLYLYMQQLTNQIAADEQALSLIPTENN